MPCKSDIVSLLDYLKTHGADYKYWISLNDKTTEGTFEWGDTGQQVSIISAFCTDRQAAQRGSPSYYQHYKTSHYTWSVII